MPHITWLAPSPHNGICPLCAAAGGHEAEIEAPHPLPGNAPIRFIRCGACASLFTDPPAALDYDHSETSPEIRLRHYLEVGAGIHAMLRRAASVEGAQGKRFLDVGCGYGFAVDAWRRQVCPEAVGVELARYGRIGAERLGVTVYDRLLGQIPELQGRRFDIVQAIEVIEHVPDVQAFLADLDDRLAPGGVLALSTPCADFVGPAGAAAETLSLLSPGFHAFLFSQKALDAALRRRFDYVRVLIERETLSAWASHAPFELDAAFTEAIYIPYLEQLWGDIGERDALYDGIAYRLFKEKLNRGDIAGAARPMKALEESYRAKYGPAVLDPETAGELGNVADLSGYGRLPFGLANYHFFRAIYARLAENDPQRAALGFRAAARIALRGGQVCPAYFQEALSLVWIARQQEGIAWAVQGDTGRARTAFEEILAAHAAGEGLPIRPGDELARSVAGNLADVSA
ncbi:MAG: class I SAM-dependent methyltransferase [Burkholderiales bacterium]